MPIGMFQRPAPGFWAPNTASTSPTCVAVSFIYDGEGAVGLVLCSAGDRADSFYGFVDVTMGPPYPATSTVYCARGAGIRVLVEDDAELVPNESVYLSDTLGRVTQTPPSSTNCLILRVGNALGADTIILNFDPRVRIP